MVIPILTEGLIKISNELPKDPYAALV